MKTTKKLLEIAKKEVTVDSGKMALEVNRVLESRGKLKVRWRIQEIAKIS